jgi:CDP-diacylglycerol--serine O-phosphatidyltransferase
MVTLSGMCCGLTSIRLAMDAKFEASVTLIVLAAIIDGMDGRIARMLNATSTFGAQLDSLSDFLCFGVAPVIVMYLWSLHDLKGIGWAFVLFYTVCCALRLARFNTSIIEDEERDRHPWKQKFFVGIPSPAGALLCLLPIVVSFYVETFSCPTTLAAVWVALVGSMMASRIPTFAVKKIKVHHEWVLAIMLAFGICIVVVLVEPWFMYTVLAGGYVSTIPFSYNQHRKLAKLSANQAGASLPE